MLRVTRQAARLRHVRAPRGRGRVLRNLHIPVVPTVGARTVVRVGLEGDLATPCNRSDESGHRTASAITRNEFPRLASW
jgi:hypothetical protein